MKKLTAFPAVFAAGLLCFAIFAQDKPAAKRSTSSAGAAMPMPKPAPEMKDLRDFVGTWSGDERYEASPFMPSGGSGTGTNTIRLGPGGFSTLMEVRSKGPMGAFSAHAVMTWDPNEKAYKFFWTDSMTPGVMVATGHKDGNNLVFTGETHMMGKKMAVKDVLSDRTPTSYTLTSYMNDGSGEKKTMTIKFTRQEPAPRK